MRRLWKWIVGIVVVAVIVGVGGPYFYIHVIEGTAPAKFSLSAGTTPGGPGVPLNGTWSVAPGSQVGFRVQEVLFGQNNTAVGRTSVISGTISISGTKVESGSFVVDMRTIKTDQPSRSRQIQGPIMDTSQFPTATFKLTKPIDFGTPPADGVVIDEQATGNLTLRDTTRSVTLALQTRHSGATIEVVGSTTIVFSDYKIPNPSTLFNGITTQDHGILEFLLDFTKGSAQPATTVAPTTTTSPNSAFAACMAAHGETVPSFRGGGGGGGGPGGPPGGPPDTSGPTTTLDPAMQAALNACQSQAPRPSRPTPDSTTVPPYSF